ncbi:hypothetical protein GJ496_004389 [Pomphorhynchus laevis]|nr:hypothetical protein GJ496_004389 [Pomphorhynchus laevis]
MGLNWTKLYNRLNCFRKKKEQSQSCSDNVETQENKCVTVIKNKRSQSSEPLIPIIIIHTEASFDEMDNNETKINQISDSISTEIISNSLEYMSNDYIILEKYAMQMVNSIFTETLNICPF